MYLVTISNQIDPVSVKSKKELRVLLEKVCPPLGLQYPSIDWVIEKMKLNSRIKLQKRHKFFSDLSRAEIAVWIVSVPKCACEFL